ncbi:hypothetical protein [Hansschlegelia zhihuaiae]|uniref:Uncharacterized protein n=1 Tax=Hansschlegelia zhihuaiae TaxID=405005 RepID=A0A4Q0MQP6_9HYPH|nr:hypothetical protein [Hansschlegelia zhihuaiae]RXF75549.1 hypothetical protein EK403_01470 [Hansschlegelia zhihuaiae]
MASAGVNTSAIHGRKESGRSSDASSAAKKSPIRKVATGSAIRKASWKTSVSREWTSNRS